MNLNKLKIFAFCAGICVLLSGCETASPEVTDPPQKQASAIKSQGGVYKVGNPYKILGRWYYPKEDYSYSGRIFMPSVPPTAKNTTCTA